MMQLSSEETVGSALASLGMRQLADTGLREHLHGVFATASIVRGYEMTVPAPDGRARDARVGASLIPASTEAPLALVSIELSVPSSPEVGHAPA
jgi:hypothetical protein